MSDTKETQIEDVIEVSNKTLLNQFFSAALQKACSLIWGMETDEGLFRVLDAVSEGQTHLQRMQTKYANEAQDSDEAKAEKEKLWEDLIEGTTKIPGPKLTLALTEKNNLTAMERFQLRPLFDIKKK